MERRSRPGPSPLSTELKSSSTSALDDSHRAAIQPEETEIQQASQSPFDLLASELIGRIIVLAVQATDHWNRPKHKGKMKTIYFPYTALFVSKLWREVALSTPEAWTSVFIRNSSPDEYKLISKLSHHSKNAGTLPLNLFYFLDSDSFSQRGDLRLDGPRTQRLRWQKVTIGVPVNFRPRLYMYHTLIDLIQTTRPETFQELEIIGDLPADGHHGPSSFDDLRWKAKMVSFASLRKLHCSAINFKPSKASSPLVIPNLQELRLQNITNEESLGILRFAHLPALTHLGIQFVLDSKPSYYVDKPLSDVVSALADKWSEQFQAPSLRHLVLLNIPDPAIIADFLSAAPDLETLILCCRVGVESVNLPALLQLPICPDLRTLGVCDLPFEYMDNTGTTFVDKIVEARIPMLLQLVVEKNVPTSEEDIWNEVRERVQVIEWTRDAFDFDQVFDRIAVFESL